MAKYKRFDPENKKAGRKKQMVKLGLNTRFAKIIEKENVQPYKPKVRVS